MYGKWSVRGKGNGGLYRKAEYGAGSQSVFEGICVKVGNIESDKKVRRIKLSCEPFCVLYTCEEFGY
ncbi:hypothetical protein CE91St51_05950 [[Clostridium] innocuum]|nr:hypothetical protein CE91St51_05950 [[Clostridium] innocuum]